MRQPVRNDNELMNEGRGEELAGNWEAAGDLYQRLVTGNPGNREAVKRLLMVYRRLKDFRNELSAIEAALGAVAKRDQSEQGKWLTANPQAAKLGKAMLRSLGGEKVTAYGTDAFVGQLLKRKDLVQRKLNGVKRSGSMTKDKFAGTNATGKPKKRLQEHEKDKLQARKKKERMARQLAERSAATEKKREEAAAKSAKAREIREAAAIVKKEKAERIKTEKKQKLAAREAGNQPSFFIISLRYLEPLRKIDAAMSKHVAFLERYFFRKVFLMAGRQVPRTGGIIVARGKDQDALHKIMRQDPFVKGKLASFTIIEFKGSRIIKGLHQ